MRIIIGGALGRMGREVSAAAAAAGIDVGCGVDIVLPGREETFPIVKEYSESMPSADAVIDFSGPQGLSALLDFCIQRSMPAVLCTTGYTEEEIRQIEQAALSVAVLRSANMSLGVNVMERLVALAAKALGSGYDIEIVEKHHRMKVDSPSGTALMLYDAAQKGAGLNMEPVFGRHGRADERKETEIGIHAVRGGTVTGEHEVAFYGAGEQLLLTHRAESRALFAQGALRAASFLADKPARLYTMRDVVAEILP